MPAYKQTNRQRDNYKEIKLETKQTGRQTEKINCQA